MGNSYGREHAWQLLTEWTLSESLRNTRWGRACVTACGEAEAGVSGWRGSAPCVHRAYATTLCCTTSTMSATHGRGASVCGRARVERLGWPRSCAPHSGPRGVQRRTALTHLAKSLFACDELAGFLTACALVKPTKAIADVEVASVRKKMKDKAFARGVNRADILQGVAELASNWTRTSGFVWKR